MGRPYLTAHQVAGLLQLNVETVYALIAREGLPATRVGRRWRFDESQVHRWFHDHCNETDVSGDNKLEEPTRREFASRVIGSNKRSAPISTGFVGP